MSTQSALDRYLNDAQYKQVVDMFEHLLHTAQLTPAEMREAAVLASINYENRRIRSFHISMTPELHARLEELHNIVEKQR